MLEVELFLAHRLQSDNMATDMMLEYVCNSQLDIVSMQPLHVV